MKRQTKYNTFTITVEKENEFLESLKKSTIKYELMYCKSPNHVCIKFYNTLKEGSNCYIYHDSKYHRIDKYGNGYPTLHIRFFRRSQKGQDSFEYKFGNGEWYTIYETIF